MNHRSDVWREVFTALGLSTGAAVALGFSRFAYALLLPPMRADLGWTYVEAGALNTANGAGYIVGALVAAWAARRWGTARAFLAGFWVSLACLKDSHPSSAPSCPNPERYWSSLSSRCGSWSSVIQYSVI